MLSLYCPSRTHAHVWRVDGVWGALDDVGVDGSAQSAAERSEPVVLMVDAARRERGAGAGEAAQELVARAARRGSTDNACALVLYLAPQTTTTDSS